MFVSRFYWSFDRKTLLDDEAKAQKLISVEMREMHTFHFEMHETVDFHSNLVVSWELLAIKKTYGMCAFHRKTLTRRGNSLVYLLVFRILKKDLIYLRF